MSTSLFLAAALMAQAPATLTVPAPSMPANDVGYHELMAGRPEAAIARIEHNGLANAGDPVALINLGTAYKMIGRNDDAAKAYRAAASSDERYDIEMANGRWVDSRRAAKIAIARIVTNEVLALK
jgi:cytochrome c-type biogenesis protein CcmH/NrfG